MRLAWRCRACGAEGYDHPGLASFWAHHRAFHMPQAHSIFAGVVGR